MSVELETGAAASTGAMSNAQTADLSGQPCQNCRTPSVERYCPKCGQLAASFHRPIWSLLSETITDTLALDGRLARTLPTLMFRPGRLTKNYIDGYRARYVPPFRMFLLASLVFYLALFSVIGDGAWLRDVRFGGDDAANADLIAEYEQIVVGEDGTVDAEALKALIEREVGRELDASALKEIDRATGMMNDPRLFAAYLEQWAPRLSFLLVPFTILILTALHFWRRKMYVYDHAIHALHLHTWVYLAATFLILLLPFLGGWAAWIFGVSLALYIFQSLRTVGDSGYFVSFSRTVLLLFIWLIIVSTLVVGALIVSAVMAAGGS